MRTALIALTVAFVAAATPLSAQTARTLGSSSSSSTHSSSSSASMGGAGGTATVQNYYGATGSGGGGGSSSATIHNTPDLATPGLYGGTNPCAVGVSGGVSVAGLGIGGGGTWAGSGCERRNAAVILFQAGMPDVAVALLCQDDDIREAFREAGKPCPKDRPKPAVAEARPSDGGATAQPAAAVVQPEIDARPAWCGQPVRTEADRATYNYYCKLSPPDGAAGGAGVEAVAGTRAAVSMR